MVNNTSSINQPETTGKYLVLLREDTIEAGIQTLFQSAGIRSVARACDFEDSAVSAGLLGSEETLAFDKLGVAVATLDPDQFESLSSVSAAGDSVLAVEPEKVIYAFAEIGNW